MPLSRSIARFNRRFANHLAGPLFTRLPGFGTVHHRGRRSGTVYRTPVKLFRSGADYIITLPYGSRADWVRNVLAAEDCEITSRGIRVRVGAPRVIAADESSGIPAKARWALARIGATELLALSPLPERRQGETPDERASDAATFATAADSAGQPGEDQPG